MVESNFLTPELLGVIITAIIGIAGGKFVQFKTKLSAFTNVIKEIDIALEDNEITPKEAKRIINLLKGLIK